MTTATITPKKAARMIASLRDQRVDVRIGIKTLADYHANVDRTAALLEAAGRDPLPHDVMEWGREMRDVASGETSMWSPDIKAQTAEAQARDGRVVTVVGRGHHAKADEDGDPNVCGRCGHALVYVKLNGGLFGMEHIAD